MFELVYVLGCFGFFLTKKAESQLSCRWSLPLKLPFCKRLPCLSHIQQHLSSGFPNIPLADGSRSIAEQLQQPFLYHHPPFKKF